MTESISVVMPVLNAMPFLDEAISSILRQTHQEFELVCLDDGSTDGSLDALHRWADSDPRIKVFSSASAKGLANSSNEVVERASHEIVVRMDSDDISHPQRLALQLSVMRRHQDCVVCGTLADGIDTEGRRIRRRDRTRLLARGIFSPFPHGSAMFRRSAFDRAGGYRPEADGWEELDLWIRMNRYGSTWVLPQPLYSYRYRDGATTAAMSLHKKARAVALSALCIAELARSNDYTATLHQGPTEEQVAAAMIDSYAMQSALCIWAGRRPNQPLDGMLKSAPRLSKARLYGTIGTRAPRFLRALMALSVALKDLKASRRIDEEEVEWHFVHS